MSFQFSTEAIIFDTNRQIIEQENIYQKTLELEAKLLQHMQEVAKQVDCLQNIRCIGGIVAADLTTSKTRLGYEIFQAAVKRGALLRPIGNTIYWFPPLNITDDCLQELREITIASIQECCN